MSDSEFLHLNIAGSRLVHSRTRATCPRSLGRRLSWRKSKRSSP